MQTPSALSPAKQALLERRLKGLSSGGCEIPVRTQRDAAPLSSAQRQMWVIDQITPGNPAYNLPNGYRLRGPLDVAALEASFNEVIKRHEALRTTFAVQDGEPSQRIHPELRLSIKLVALDGLDGEEREAALHAAASEESVASFDLSRLPLLRVSLFRLAETDHALLVNIHHIVADGFSVALLLEELHAFYRSLTRGDGAQPPPLAVQYADFALWQRQTMAHPRELDFWRRQLCGKLPVLELAGDRARPAYPSFKGSNVFFELPAAQARDLAALGAREGCTLFMALLALFQLLLQRYSGADDIIIGTPVEVREPRGVEPLIGNFLNMAPLRCDLSGDPSFVELLRRSRERTLEAFSNSALPFEAMVEQLKFERDASRNPIFQTMLQFLSTPAPRLGDLDVSTFHFDLEIAQFDLSLHLYEEAGTYIGRFEYSTDLFEERTVRRLCGHYLNLLAAAVREPQRNISRLPMLGDAEQRQLLAEWNDTRAECPDATVHELFQAQASRTPERIALVFEGKTVSYAELEQRASSIAHALRSRGIGRGQRVGLCLERGVDMLAALLGVLKAGAAYVPLDPAFPAQRLRFMAQDAELALLLNDASGFQGAPHGERAAEALAARPVDPAYLIYTSGSTGQPKGVVVPHRAVVNFLTSMARRPGLGAEDVLVAVTTLSFDIAVLELLLPLTLGARVVIATRDDTMNGNALAALLAEHRATVLQATPVTWRLLLQAGWSPRGAFKALVGGEALPRELAGELLAHGVELWNMYGPTETTVWSTCARITDTVSIGKPIDNTIVRILDGRQNLCPTGVPGELCIGGRGVALGYWKRAELSAERFVADPFGDGTLYRTGDRARWLSDGTLEHLGRLDFQVKLRGFRIEPGEIEVRIAQHPAVREVVVVLRDDALVAYFAGDNDIVDELRALLRAELPEYMVLTYFVAMETLPLTHNGKIDRRLLPPPAGAGMARRGAAAARTPTEEMVMGEFRRVLGRQDFGVEDDFFDLGGHSLLAARLMSGLRKVSGCNLPLRYLFERPTVGGLAEAIDGLAWLGKSRAPSRHPANREEIEL